MCASPLLSQTPRQCKRGGTSRLLVMLAGSLLLALTFGPPARAAEISYKIQPLVKVGDTIGGVKIIGPVSPSNLNDHGDLAFLANASPGSQALFSVTTGPPVVITPLVTGGGQGPDGAWPKSLSINPLVSINQPG